jgi:putative lysine transport system substrate-binding protein
MRNRASQAIKVLEFKDGFKTSDDDTAIAVGLKKGSDLTAKVNEILKGISEQERTTIMDNAIKNQPAAK